MCESVERTCEDFRNQAHDLELPVIRRRCSLLTLR